jgi:hypothetical protein
MSSWMCLPSPSMPVDCTMIAVGVCADEVFVREEMRDCRKALSDSRCGGRAEAVMFRWMLQGQVLDRRQRQQATSSASESQARAQRYKLAPRLPSFRDTDQHFFLGVYIYNTRGNRSREIFLDLRKIALLARRANLDLIPTSIASIAHTRQQNINQRHHNGRPLGLGPISLLRRLNTVRSRQRRTLLLPKVHMNRPSLDLTNQQNKTPPLTYLSPARSSTHATSPPEPARKSPGPPNTAWTTTKNSPSQPPTAKLSAPSSCGPPTKPKPAPSPSCSSTGMQATSATACR